MVYDKYNPLPSNRNNLAVYLYEFSTEITKLSESKSKSVSKSEKKKHILKAWNALSNLRFILKEYYTPRAHFMNDEDIIFHRLYKIMTETTSFNNKKGLENTPNYLVDALQRWPELFYSDTLTINLKSSIDITYSLLEKDKHFAQPTSHSPTSIRTVIKKVPIPVWVVIIFPTLLVSIPSCYYNLKQGLTLGEIGIIVGIWTGIEIALATLYIFVKKLSK